MNMFLALLPRKDLSVMWKRDESKTVYVGRRQVCNNQMTTFSSSTFGMFQCKICTTLDKKAQLWRDGLILLQVHAVHSHVECLVAMHTVDLVLLFILSTLYVVEAKEQKQDVFHYSTLSCLFGEVC